MIGLEELKARKAALQEQLVFALSTQAKATEAKIRTEIEILELALIGLRRSELNND